MKRKFAGFLITFSLPAGLFAAAEIAWDVSEDPGVQGGPGTWNMTDTNWTTDDGESRFAWDNETNRGDLAVFGNPAGNVSIEGEVRAAGVKLTKNG